MSHRSLCVEEEQLIKAINLVGHTHPRHRVYGGRLRASVGMNCQGPAATQSWDCAQVSLCSHSQDTPHGLCLDESPSALLIWSFGRPLRAASYAGAVSCVGGTN